MYSAAKSLQLADNIMKSTPMKNNTVGSAVITQSRYRPGGEGFWPTLGSPLHQQSSHLHTHPPSVHTLEVYCAQPSVLLASGLFPLFKPFFLLVLCIFAHITHNTFLITLILFDPSILWFNFTLSVHIFKYHTSDITHDNFLETERSGEYNRPGNGHSLVKQDLMH